MMNEENLFHLALETPPGERAALLDDACQGDAELRGRVERLLAEHERQQSFVLDTPPAGLDVTTFRSLAEQPGAIIGPYKLLQQIGEGGMGVVFMAEQHHPLQRTVALKIIKPGMDTRLVIARFEAERQAVAMMDHPNIAKVLDAGTTDSGRPYFVMELVKGVPITKYCDEKHLPLRERLELFTQVCQAVQHAHQKGIIHRDIKPNNVLVAEYDHHAIPKVIDFGVAKATAQKLTERTLFTEFGQVLGTMEYMSPEQAKLNQLDIDTRSDIYSLGVLLYELLTGSTPFEAKRLHEAAFDEMLRIIREEEPPKPSTRLSSSEALPSIAANRSLEPLKLNRLVQGELDWIVMKSLEKDRNRRYESAAGFAADLERYLNDEAVEARPTTRMYQLRKFIRRNKAGALAGAAIVAALMIGLALASIGFVQARRQAQVAAAQAAKATAINNLLQQMLRSASPYSAKGKDYTVRQMLEDFSASLGDQIHDQPEIEAAIRATIGGALLDLEQTDEAEPQLKGALEIRRRLFGEDHPDVASSYVDCAYVALYRYNFPEAERLLRKALAIHEKLGDETEAAISTLSSLGLTLYNQTRYREAEAAYEKAYETARRMNFRDQAAIVLQRQAALALAIPGGAAKAEQLARESLALQRQLSGNHHPSTAWALRQLATILVEENKLDEAEQTLREALAVFREHFGDADYLVHIVRDELKVVLAALGDQPAVAAIEAEQSANEAVALVDYDKSLRLRPDSPYRLIERSVIHSAQGDFDKAHADLERATKLGLQPSYAIMLRALVCLTRNDDAGFREASKTLADGAALGNDRTAAQHATIVFVAAPNSVIDSERALEFAQKNLDSGVDNDMAHFLFAMTLYRIGRYEEAALKLTEGLDAFGEAGAKTGLDSAAYLFMAMTQQRLGHPQEAEDWLNRAVPILDASHGVTGYWPYSMLLKRLRQETEALLGEEREPAKRQPAESTDQQAPANSSTRSP